MDGDAAAQAFALTSAGARGRLTFRVTTPPLPAGQHRIQAVATSGGRTYSTGYQVIRHRDLPLRYLVREAAALVSAMDVAVRPGVRVGYVMGVGDELPAAIAQLGAAVTLLDRDALATGDLTRFDVIVTGTRAYAVRDDLRAHNRRLLDWVRGGGRMVVLYNTPEFVPDEFAPYDATLPGNAEEVSEQAAAGRDPRAHACLLHDTQPDHERRLRRLDRTARVEVLRELGRQVHAAAVEPRSGAAGAAGRMADGQRRQGAMDLHGLRAPPAGAVRRRRGVSDSGKSD